jgi:ABC-type nitrate/sulfonate/bicarbonate transport system substrate-binding protein
VLHLIPPTVADEMNFFVEEGLCDAEGRAAYELVRDSHAPFMFEQVALAQTMKERGIDVCVDVKPSTVAYLRQHGHDIYVIAGWRNQSPHFIFGSRAVKSLAQVAGKRIGIIDFDDILVTVVSYWLMEEGVDPRKDVEWVRGIDPKRAPAALREGRIDAGFIDPRDVPLLEGEGFSRLMEIRRQYPNGRPDRTIAATGRAIDQRPAEVRAFLKGIIRAYWFLRKQPENLQVTQAIERRLRRQSNDPDEPHRPLQFGSADDSERMPFPYDGVPTGLQQYLDEAHGLGVLEAPMDEQGIVRLELVREAFDELEARDNLRSELARAKAVVARLGY